MAKDPNYDRYAGIVSLPTDPSNPGKPRPFRVDEDGNVIHLDEEPDAARLPGAGKPRRPTQAGILDWDELDGRLVGPPTGMTANTGRATIPAAEAGPKLGVSGARSSGDLGPAQTGATRALRRIGGIDYDVIEARTFDPSKSSGATAIPNADLMATAIANKKQVVRNGLEERGAYFTRKPSELPWSDRFKIGRTKLGDDEPYLEVPVQDSYFSVPRLDAKTKSTASASTFGFGDRREWPKGTMAFSHGHIDDGLDQSDGMVDVVDPKIEKSYGDSASLVIKEPMPLATVSEGQVGWHFIENGQLKFMYPVGSKIEGRRRKMMQDNLDKAQIRYRDRSK